MRRFFKRVIPALVVGLLPLTAFGSDQETAQKVADALRGSGRLHDYSIGVKFEDGKAVLLGRVASDEQAEAAVEMAHQLPYVKNVENRLEVKPSPKRDTAVTQVGHNGRSQGTVSRDEAVFGSSKGRKTSTSQVQQTSSEMPIPPGGPMPASYQSYCPPGGGMGGGHTGSPIPVGYSAGTVGQRVAYDQAHMPCHAWPAYAAYPNYAAVTYPNQYSASAWPYIGPFYPYPQVPLGWRRVSMEWKDGWWWLDFNDHARTFRR